MTRPGRPRGSFGEISRAALTELTAHPLPVRDLAHRLQVPRDVAQQTVKNLQAAGMVTAVDAVPVRGERTVKVYGISHAHVIALSWPRFE